MTAVVVVTQSKHGATREVGERVAAALADAGHAVRQATPDEVTELAPGEAVVLGSGVYAGSWLRPMGAFVDRFEDELREREVFAFSCGPVGDPLRPDERPKTADGVAQKAGAPENRLFGGVVDRSSLSLPERTILRMLKVPDGDYRDWNEIDAWARDVATTLSARS